MDSVANMLVIIKNGYMAKKVQVLVPYSKFKFEIAKVLEKEKFVTSIQKEDRFIKIELAYKTQTPMITEIKRVSKQGLRVHTKSKHIIKVKGGRGIYIISTPKGVMSSQEARAKNLGGEVICRIW